MSFPVISYNVKLKGCEGQSPLKVSHQAVSLLFSLNVPFANAYLTYINWHIYYFLFQGRKLSDLLVEQFLIHLRETLVSMMIYSFKMDWPFLSMVGVPCFFQKIIHHRTMCVMIRLAHICPLPFSYNQFNPLHILLGLIKVRIHKLL